MTGFSQSVTCIWRCAVPMIDTYPVCKVDTALADPAQARGRPVQFAAPIDQPIPAISHLEQKPAGRVRPCSLCGKKMAPVAGAAEQGLPVASAASLFRSYRFADFGPSGRR